MPTDTQHSPAELVNPPGFVDIPDRARTRLAGLLELYDNASRWGAVDAADLSQLVEALRWRDIAKKTWATFHDYAAGVAGADPGNEVDAVNDVCHQIRAGMCRCAVPFVRCELHQTCAKTHTQGWRDIAQRCQAGTVKVTDGILTDWLDALQRGNDVIFGHAEAQGLADVFERYEGALRQVVADAGGRCETFTRGSCRDENSGRTRGAEYGADRWCDPCIALDALAGRALSGKEG